MERIKFVYDGPVLEFGRLVDENWHGETMAISEKKATSNLIYQWKMIHDRKAGSKVTLGTVPRMAL